MTTATSGRYAVAGKNLALLQDVIRRDPESYKEEFMQQHAHLENLMRLVELQPNFDNNSIDVEEMESVVNFLTATCQAFPSEAKSFTALLMSVLALKCQQLPAPLRLCLCKALMTMRNRGVADALDVLELCFEMVKSDDKILRKYIFTSLVTSIAGGSRSSRKKQRKHQKSVHKLSPQVQSKVHNSVIRHLNDSRTVVSHMALLLLIKAYRKQTWMNAKSANAIGNCCFHKMPKLQVAAMKFLLGNRRGEGECSDVDSDASGNEENERTMKEIMTGYKAGKKTAKRKKQMDRAKEQLSKQLKKKKVKKSDRDCNINALQQLHDPQEFAEHLFRKLDGQKTERFEVRLLRMSLLAQLIGHHELVVLPFYNYIQRYLTPQQREVTHLLLYTAQASHKQIPPDTMLSVIRCIADNFVSDRNSAEAITVGLNSISQILQRCPYAIDDDLLRDLTEYKKYNNANVRMAAKTLINLYRDENRTLLHRKDRARPTVASKEHRPAVYGVANTVSFVPGAEVLAVKRAEPVGEQTPDDEDMPDEEDSCFDDDDDEEENLGSDEEDGDEEGDGQGSEEDDEEEDVEDSETEDEADMNKQTAQAAEQSAKEAAEIYSTTHIFDEDEHRRIARHQLSKHIKAAKKREPVTAKRAKLNADAEGDESDEASDMDSDEEIDDGRVDAFGLPTLTAIEHLHKKPRRATKQERLETVHEGREGREKFGRPKEKGSHVGRTNKQIAKKKNFMMVKSKVRGKNRQRSYAERQRALSNFMNKAQKGRKRR